MGPYLALLGVVDWAAATRRAPSEFRARCRVFAPDAAPRSPQGRPTPRTAATPSRTQEPTTTWRARPHDKTTGTGPDAFRADFWVEKITRGPVAESGFPAFSGHGSKRQWTPEGRNDTTLFAKNRWPGSAQHLAWCLAPSPGDQVPGVESGTPHDALSLPYEPKRGAARSLEFPRVYARKGGRAENCLGGVPMMLIIRDGFTGSRGAEDSSPFVQQLPSSMGTPPKPRRQSQAARKSGRPPGAGRQKPDPPLFGAGGRETNPATIETT